MSPRLARALATDSLHPVWLFARPGTTLDGLATWVRANGGTVRRTSRWLHAVSAVLPPGAMSAARALRGLERIQPVARFRQPRRGDWIEPEVLWAAPAAPTQDSVYGNSAMPFRRLNLFPLVDQGLRGAGVRIAVLDTGFETELTAFDSATVVAQYDFVFNDSIVRNEAIDAPIASTHGTSVWSLLAARIPGSMMGIAPRAEYLLAKTEDVRSETPLEEDNYVAALEWADSIGVDVVTSSLGYLLFDDGSGYAYQDLNGDIAVTTRAADSAVARGIALLTAMGNEGPAAGTLITPADGDSVLSIGAEDSTGVVAAFSSRGPTADGRIKPDFSAPGVAIWVVVPQGGLAGLGRGNGTSFSTPIMAGASALFLEAHPGYDPIALRTALRQFGDQRMAPDNVRGWGRPDFHRATTFPRGLLLTESADSLTAVTPRLTWSIPDAPAFSAPFTFRLRVTAVPSAQILQDTTLADTTFTLPDLLHGGVALRWSVTATSVDSAVIQAQSDSELVIPPWVRLETLNNQAGSTIRELRPEFRWSSPEVSAPPGPFRYTLQVVRADNGAVDLEADSLTETTYVPPVDLERNTPYRWRVTAHLESEFETTQSRSTFVILDDTAPPVTTLFQNFPNPFPQPAAGQLVTCLWFDLAVEGYVSLEILDVRGLLVRRLLPGPGGLGPLLRPGRYGRPEVGESGCAPQFAWDGTTDRGETVNAGVYLAKLDTPDGVFVKRIVFLGTDP